MAQKDGQPFESAAATVAGSNISDASMYAPPPKAVPVNFAELFAGVAVANSPLGPVVSPFNVTEPSLLTTIFSV